MANSIVMNLLVPFGSLFDDGAFAFVKEIAAAVSAAQWEREQKYFKCYLLSYQPYPGLQELMVSLCQRLR